ncbi:MAG: ABC transporter ATP-binding protein [Planctomycetes bacterium]|nr:ABC transporter ATP-binding protein [Planctomycetota bacterium]
MTAVSIQNLTVRYDTGALVLDGVSLEIGHGEFFFLLGPSGCGKTTLLRSVAGFVEPTKGSIQFDGRDLTRVPAEKRDCGMVFQNYALWPHMTVEQNVAFGLDVRKVGKDEKARRVREALELVRMESFADRHPNRLSGGQQQRVALARALVVEPAVLLLDEPLSNLDAALRLELRVEIREIQRRTKRTAMYVTHDRAEALALADRIAVLRGGHVEQLGAPRELYDEPATPFIAGFVGDVNTLAGHVVAADANGVVVSGEFGTVRGRVTARGARFQPSATVNVLVRPERLRVVADLPPGQNALRGRVTRVTFLGELLQHDVEVGGGAVVRVLSLGGSPSFPEGSTVTLVVDDALVFPT